MARNRIIAVNYVDLIVSTLKEKYIQILLGIIVLLSILILLPISGNKKSTVNKKASTEESGQEKAVEKNYTVRSGDHLWSIAENTYGSGYNAYDIAKANKIVDPNIIVIGQKLTLPQVAPKTPTKGEIVQAKTQKVVNTDSTYVVKTGDNLWKIALEAYGDGYAWTQIAKTNNLTNPDLIYPDTKLRIPKNSSN